MKMSVSSLHGILRFYIFSFFLFYVFHFIDFRRVMAIEQCGLRSHIHTFLYVAICSATAVIKCTTQKKTKTTNNNDDLTRKLPIHRIPICNFTHNFLSN